MFATLDGSPLAAFSAFHGATFAPTHCTFDRLSCSLTLFSSALCLRWHSIIPLALRRRLKEGSCRNRFNPSNLCRLPSRRATPHEAMPTEPGLRVVLINPLTFECSGYGQQFLLDKRALDLSALIARHWREKHPNLGIRSMAKRKVDT